MLISVVILWENQHRKLWVDRTKKQHVTTTAIFDRQKHKNASKPNRITQKPYKYLSYCTIIFCLTLIHLKWRQRWEKTYARLGRENRATLAQHNSRSEFKLFGFRRLVYHFYHIFQFLRIRSEVICLLWNIWAKSKGRKMEFIRRSSDTEPHT